MTAADRVRRALDRRFARALAAWYTAGRPAANVLPIDKAFTRVGRKFLDDDSSRRLLVLLFDGMAWAQAVELMQSMAQRGVLWGPLAWHASRKGRIGARMIYPVMLANIPSLTDVSRSAFFAGKPMKPGVPHKTDKDKERWQGHRGMDKYAVEGRAVRLFPRGDGHLADGSASRKVLASIDDPAQRVVAAVINAIDASLKGDPQTRNRWGVDDIKSLAELLEHARDADRAVLMVSDHGHVPAGLMVSERAPRRGGARWRPIVDNADANVAGDYEVVFEGERAKYAWWPRGARGVVLLADEEHRYGGSAHAGDHGGASLAEIVAPCVLLGCEDARPARDDPAQAVRSAYVPSWWYFEVGDSISRQSAGAAVTAEAASAASAQSRARRIPENQLSLPQLAPAEKPAAAAAPASASRENAEGVAMDTPFARCELLVARTSSLRQRQRVVRAVAYLHQTGGAASAVRFANHMGEITGRVGGLVSRLQRVLNVDGYQVLYFDRKSQQVHLDKNKLEQQFEIRL